MHHFPKEYDPFGDSSWRKLINIDDDGPCMLDLLDTTGTSEASAMRELYVRTGHAFLIVYAITNQKSFEFVRGIHDFILHVKEAEAREKVKGKVEVEKQHQVNRPADDAEALKTSEKAPVSIFISKVKEKLAKLKSTLPASSKTKTPKTSSTDKGKQNHVKLAITLVGNKSDRSETDREVSYTAGVELARELQCPFYEVSARSGSNVEEAFHELVRTLHRNRQETEAQQQQPAAGQPVSTDSKASRNTANRRKRSRCLVM